MIGRPPIAVRDPGGRPAPAVPSVIAMIRDGDLAAIATRTIDGMDVNAVADELRRHVVVLEHGSGQARARDDRSASCG